MKIYTWHMGKNIVVKVLCIRTYLVAMYDIVIKETIIYPLEELTAQEDRHE